MPGPDWVSIIQWDPSGAAEQRKVQPGRAAPTMAFSPNPSRGRAQLALTLPCPGLVVLDLFDATGRSVRSLLRADLPVGSHVLDTDLAGIPAGVYVARCQWQGGVATTRLVLGD
jgi:hypothetical protein